MGKVDGCPETVGVGRLGEGGEGAPRAGAGMGTAPVEGNGRRAFLEEGREDLVIASAQALRLCC